MARVVKTLRGHARLTEDNIAEAMREVRMALLEADVAGASWPLRWSEQENIAWKLPISGRGWSSPVVSDQQIWLTTALDTAATVDVTKRTLERRGKDVPSPQVASHLTLKAICVDRASGRVLHDVTLFEIDEPEVISSSNSFASPTPVVDRGRVFCEFGALGTACVDAATGAVVWSRRLVVDTIRSGRAVRRWFTATCSFWSATESTSST